MKITIVDNQRFIADDAWDFPLEELEYLLEEHDGETFVLHNGRLYETEHKEVK